MICKICKLPIYGDCMLTGRPDVEGVCVFCHYKTNTWDSNGQLVTKKEATQKECFNCGRIVPNPSWINNEGCKWCIPRGEDK